MVRQDLAFQNASPDEPAHHTEQVVCTLARHAPTALAYVEHGRVCYANEQFKSLFHLDNDNPDAEIAEIARNGTVPMQAVSAVQDIVARVTMSGERIVDEPVLASLADEQELLWRVSAWPVEQGTSGPIVALMIHANSRDVRRQQAHQASVGQLREVNEQLLLATLREEELRIQAEAASYAKSVFVATMSHELRTPLAAILGYGELLHSGVTGPVNEPQQRQLGRILASANHLLAIINEILTLASIESHHERLNLEQIDVRQLLDSASALIAPLVEAKGLAFALDVPDEPLTIRSDALKLRQILVNLLGNSVKFTDEGEVALHVHVDGERVVFEVRDSGIGIAPRDLERIFDAFWQVRDAPVTRRFGGSGLGLNVSRKLAQLMGGDISVESALGTGSVFRLVLPVVPPDEPNG